MKHLIDKAAVVAEIKRLIDCCYKICAGNLDFLQKSYPEHYYSIETYKEILSFINTLEVKEVDFTKELDTFSMDLATKVNDGNWDKDIAVTAKHFFEFGLKARTDEELVEEVYSHLDSIKDTADRMTSGNFMHNRAAIKFSANTIAKVLELIGLKAQKGE